jgi:hypothetical protein
MNIKPVTTVEAIVWLDFVQLDGAQYHNVMILNTTGLSVARVNRKKGTIARVFEARLLFQEFNGGLSDGAGEFLA